MNRSPGGRDDHAPDEPTVTSTNRGAAHRLPYKRIGRYTLKRIIASGGMGTVYEAVQESPRRTVAIKVMKQGVASRSALRRFEYESQILGRLQHPCIAQVYEAGTHDDGGAKVPFFAMEYIPNAKHITDYAQRNKLGTRERLELFARTCDGVHYGHQKGVIHRDLKPGNILVDSGGRPRIIDFGVARATDSDMTLTTLQTEVGQLVGSFQYMSPEQCDADPHDIDTRSDVYSLGVVLYELLCGRPPYDLRRTTIPEAVRLIREQSAERPGSTNRALRGDPETIVLKTLEKSRERRYQSAHELAQDIRRYLAGEAIVARPPSVLYQLGLFARRNRALVLAIATALGILLTGIVVTTSLWVHARASRAAAVEQADRALATLDFLQELLYSADPARAGSDVRVIDLLRGYDATLSDTFRDQPEVEATVRTTIGKTYTILYLWEDAEPHLARALEIRRRVLGDEHPDTLETMYFLGISFHMLGRLDDAEFLGREALESRRRVLGEEHPDTLDSIEKLGWLFRTRGELIEAEPYYLQMVELRRRVQGPEHPDTLTSMSYLASLRVDQGRLEEAEHQSREVLELSRRVKGESHPHTVMELASVARIVRLQGRLREAETLYRQALAGEREVLGDGSRVTQGTMRNFADLLEELGELQEAEALRNEAE